MFAIISATDIKMDCVFNTLTDYFVNYNRCSLCAHYQTSESVCLVYTKFPSDWSYRPNDNTVHL